MSNTITLNMDVVKNYHIHINIKAGYASVARVGFLQLLEIFFRAFERKFRRMVERLPDQPFQIVKAQPCRSNIEEPGTCRQTPVAAGPCLALIGGSSKGALPLVFISPLGEKNLNY